MEDLGSKVLPPPLLKRSDCADSRQGISRFFFALKCALVCFALAFFVFAGNTYAQQTVFCDGTHMPSSPPTDRDALIAFYCTEGCSRSCGDGWAGDGGDGWAGDDNWMTDMLIQVWSQVTVLPDELDRVRELNLYQRGLTGRISPRLGGLTKLKILNLRGNSLTGSIPPELGNLDSLESLSLNKNMLTGRIPPQLGDLANLEAIYLRENKLTGTIPPPQLGDLTKLGTMYFDHNELTGTIPPQLADLPVLSDLQLWANKLTGTIPSELGNLSTSLLQLRIEENQLTGTIPPQLGNLALLLGLHLDNNKLTGAIPTQLGDLAKLAVLDLANNKLTGAIPSELGNLTTKLQNLFLGNNELTGTIPTQLGDLAKLTRLDLANNELTGAIPTQLGNLTKLGRLFLGNNKLTGAIPTQLADLIDVIIVPGVFTSMTTLKHLYLDNNGLTGAIPTDLKKLVQLEHLYLDNNGLTGAIPIELESLVKLEHLYLDNNGLTGAIPIELESLVKLEYLWLGNNELNGTIPPDLKDLTQLRELYLNNNELNGTIPPDLEDLTQLRELGFWGNEQLTWDTVSTELGKRVDRAALRALYDLNGGEDWTNNENWLSALSAEIFSFSFWHGVSTNMDGRVSVLNLRNNRLKGDIPQALETLGGLTELNISNNRQLTGELPLRLMDLPLETLDIRCTGVSTPEDTDFQTWLSGISFQEICPPPPPPSQEAPEQVMGVLVMMEGVGRLLVSWDSVSEADGYKIQWKSGSQQFDSSRQHITDASTTSYTISNLDAGTEYVVRVIATKSGADDGTPSPEVAGTPRAAEPLVQSPGSEGGGCSVASNAGTGNTPESIVFNLLLVVFVLVSAVVPGKGSRQFSCVLREIP